MGRKAWGHVALLGVALDNKYFISFFHVLTYIVSVQNTNVLPWHSVIYVMFWVYV